MSLQTLHPYISIDIETTGLDENRNQLLSVAAIFDNGDLEIPVEDLPSIHLKRKLTADDELVGNPIAFGMNKELIMDSLAFKEGDEDSKGAIYLSPTNICLELEQWINSTAGSMMGHTIAGKNATKTDIPFLDKLYELHESRAKGWFREKMCSHRVIDVGSLYLENFGRMVSLSKINELTGRNQVSHDALEDAMDVVVAIRNKFTIPF